MSAEYAASAGLPSPPFIEVPGIANFRDIGGYATSSPATPSIRRNLVYRCADPSRIQPEGLAKLRQLNVKKVFDLRSVPEIQRQGPEWSGVEIDKDAFVTRGAGDDAPPLNQGEIERLWTPVFSDKDYGPEQVALRYQQYAQSGSDGFVKAYSDILAHGVAAYKTILTHLSQPDPDACIVHCTAGKDRTGVLVALLYLLADVPKDTIADEYALTDRGLEHLKPLFRERLLRNPALAGNDEGVDNMIGSKSANMTATIDMISTKYGGAEGYARDVLGLSLEQIAQLRRNLAGQAAPVLPDKTQT